MMMQNDTEHALREADYAAYVDHLKNCSACGPTRCSVGEALCAEYLTRVRTMTRTALP
ncbi:hypothetical protein [Streptomyces flaveolus]|uniref:hypothetical protein n=1 Tax=Streptomyces flaveolus TaxID=67297 RepID=UPI0033C4C9F3